MKIIAIPEVQQYLESLKKILFEKEYFVFEESSIKYVNDLFDDILTTLPLCPSRPAPKYFNRYVKNMKYAIFTKNKRTTWYVFFTIYKYNGEITYLVRYIANNHTAAQYL
jgi:predicted glycosyl hydrolase (DUF1957 family)